MKRSGLLTINMLFLFPGLMLGQGGTPGNNRLFPTQFIGWNAGGAGPLDIRNNFTNQPINFFAGNSGGPLFTPTQRMTILGTTGFVGIGNGFTAPQSLLHLNDGASAIYAQFTNTATGSSAPGMGFRVGISAAGNAEIRQQLINPMQFFTRPI